jgi:desulfoferrodoxin-like iron-binding protein
MNLFICGVCAHVAFGSAPNNCPVCGVSRDRFKQNDRKFIEAEEMSREAAVKHLPLITVNKQCNLYLGQSCVDVLVRIGRILHPMEDAHFIAWIDCYVDDQYVARNLLTPSVNPAVVFHLRKYGSKARVVGLCNLHGHWQAEEYI